MKEYVLDVNLPDELIDRIFAPVTTHFPNPDDTPTKTNRAIQEDCGAVTVWNGRPHRSNGWTQPLPQTAVGISRVPHYAEKRRTVPGGTFLLAAVAAIVVGIGAAWLTPQEYKDMIAPPTKNEAQQPPNTSRGQDKTPAPTKLALKPADTSMTWPQQVIRPSATPQPDETKSAIPSPTASPSSPAESPTPTPTPSTTTTPSATSKPSVSAPPTPTEPTTSESSSPSQQPSPMPTGVAEESSEEPATEIP